MRAIFRTLGIIVLSLVCLWLGYVSFQNYHLSADVRRLEAELGRMPIEDPTRVYIVEVKSPEIPTELKPLAGRVWQFRCYLPLRYKYCFMEGRGRVTKTGIFLSSGSGGRFGTTGREAWNALITISLDKNDSEIHAMFSTTGGWSTATWTHLDPDRIDKLVVQKIVDIKQGPRSFDQNAILPLLKIYDPQTEELRTIAGKPTSTFEGGLFVLCDQKQNAVMELLQQGQMPRNFDPASLAETVDNE